MGVVGFIVIAIAVIAVFANRQRSEEEAELPSPKSEDPSIVFTRVFAGNIENGSLYDKAEIALTGYSKLIVPETARVRFDEADQRLQIYLKKSLLFVGQIDEPMTVRNTRKYMGLATRKEGEGLVLATFGEWDSHIEGGTWMEIQLIVPKKTTVEIRPDQCGVRSIAHQPIGNWIVKSPDAKDGFWFGRSSPASGWSVVPSVPDPERNVDR